VAARMRARDHACLSLIANQRFALIDVAETETPKGRK